MVIGWRFYGAWYTYAYSWSKLRIFFQALRANGNSYASALTWWRRTSQEISCWVSQLEAHKVIQDGVRKYLQDYQNTTSSLPQETAPSRNNRRVYATDRYAFHHHTKCHKRRWKVSRACLHRKSDVSYVSMFCIY